jgi:hypothetical protein
MESYFSGNHQSMGNIKYIEIYFDLIYYYPLFRIHLHNLYKNIYNTNYKLLYTIIGEFFEASNNINNKFEYYNDYSLSINNLYKYIHNTDKIIENFNYNVISIKDDTKPILGLLLTYSILNNIKIFTNVINYIELSKIIKRDDDNKNNIYYRIDKINIYYTISEYFIIINLSKNFLIELFSYMINNIKSINDIYIFMI